MRYIFASCDEKYFVDHGVQFINSAIKQDVVPWVDIINPETDLVLLSGKTIKPLNLLRMTHDDDKYKITYTKSDIKDRAQDFLVERTFYACNRFLKAPEILQSVDEVLIIDIDCFLRKPIEWEYFKDCDYSLYLRDSLPGTVGWEKEGTRVGAGAVYLKDTALPYISLVKKQIEHYGLQWFVDQVSLWVVHKHFQENDTKLRFKEMPFKYIDWEFSEDGIIWTGKGDRITQKNYLEERGRAS